MKPKLYIETTIPSYLVSPPSRDLIVAGHQQTTRVWWDTRRDDFEIFVSQFIIDEASGGDKTEAQKRLNAIESFPQLEVNDDVLRLAEALLSNNIIPKKAATDAAHIAVASVHGMDYLMTWNCAHLPMQQFLTQSRISALRKDFHSQSFARRKN